MVTFGLLTGLFLLFIVVMLAAQTRIHVATTRNNGSQKFMVNLDLLYGFVTIKYIQNSSDRIMQIRIKKIVLLNQTRKVDKKIQVMRNEFIKKTEKEQKLFQNLRNINWSICKYRLKKIIGNFSNPTLSGNFKIGLKNPMFTGILHGFFCMITGMLPQAGRNIVLQPVFNRKCLVYNINFSTMFRPFLIIWHGLLLWNKLRNAKN